MHVVRTQLNPLRWRKLSVVLVVWVIATLGIGAFRAWTIEKKAFCPEDTGTTTFCHYQALADEADAARGAFIAYGIGTVILGLAWAFTQPNRPPCPRCGSNSRNDVGVCSRCSFDPFADISVTGGTT